MKNWRKRKMENKEIVKVDVVPKFEITPQEQKNRFELLVSFINDQMNEGDDYGVIPGTQKPSLYKAGAEKLENIFGFYHTFEELNKIEDFDKGVFFYRYRCEVFSRKHNGKVGECIGSANNKEKKFVNNDPFTLTNTIDKMAQKRAYVGAILNATRVSNKFTQDVEDMHIKQSKNLTYNCEVCKTSISQKVAKFSLDKLGKMLCMDHQKEISQNGK